MPSDLPVPPMDQRSPLEAAFTRALLGGLLLLTAAYAISSLWWRPVHDVPLAIYSAFSHAEFGTRPYAELFEISFPGTILAHLGIAKVFGYGDLGSMLANLLCLLLLAALTMALLRPFGRAVGAGSALLFGLAFFLHGPEMMLQRDYFLLLPVTAALWLHCRGSGPAWLRRGAIGLSIGLAAAVKPHAGIALVPIAAADLGAIVAGAGTARLRALAMAGGCYAAGVAVPCAAVFAWLVAAGGFDAWREMSTRYLPLYLQMTKYHETIRGSDRWLYLLRSSRELGGHWPWFAPAFVGAFAALAAVLPTDHRSRVVRMLLAQCAAFAIYPVFAGQFWGYHYIPFLYFLCLLAGLCFAPIAAPGLVGKVLPKCALAFAVLIHPNIVSSTKWLARTPVVNGGQVDAMADFLRAHLRTGDTVQPLDWTGGAVHAMLISKARLATRFLYDYHLYHHVSEPFVQELRARFLTEFAAARPRFVIEYFGENKPWPTGEDTTRSFPALEHVLTTDYAVAAAGPAWRIHERRS